jgi:predicted HNH restriction endonuclease
MQTHSLKRIVEEIGKCVILCSNCHRKLHYHNKSIEQLKQELNGRLHKEYC